MLIANVTPMSIVPALRTDLPYDIRSDFEPVSQLVSAALVLVVRPDIPVKNLQELVAYARERPGKLTFASAGAGSITHLAGEMFIARAGIDALHVPYQGASPTIAALMAGQVDMGFLNISGLGPQLSAGKLRGLAVTGLQRSELLPELPPVADTFKGFEAVSWYGIALPRGTPEDIVTRLHKEFVEIMKEPEMGRDRQERRADHRSHIASPVSCEARARRGAMGRGRQERQDRTEMMRSSYALRPRSRSGCGGESKVVRCVS